MEVRFSLPIEMSDGSPPSEFRIWKFGENDTLVGKVNLDEKSAKRVMDAFNAHGVDLAIDYEHQTFGAADNGKPAPAAGWFKPEVRADGLYAANVQWTDEASGYLKARQYRYFSPTALLDAKTRTPVKLMPMALTNWPATKHIVPLVAKEGGAVVTTIPSENEMKTVLVALGLKAEADEMEAFAAVNSLREFERDILQLSGCKTIAEAHGALLAIKAKAEKAEGLEAELVALKAATIAAEATALLDEAVKDGRVAPAKRGELESLHAKHGVDALKVCLSMLPKATVAAIAPAVDAPSASAISLTEDERRILRLTGLTPEKYVEHKKRYAEIINPKDEEN